MDKKGLRREILKIRNNISMNIREKQDKLIYDKFINSELYKNANNLFIYVSFGSEVNTHKIIEKAIKDNKNVYVPKTYVDKREMAAVKIHSLDELIVDSYGILEPKNVDKINVSKEFDLIIMPGVAFDISGNRIGYGAGYYDKYISSNNKQYVKVALAYDEQIVDTIEKEGHDIKVDYIINSKKFIKTS